MSFILINMDVRFVIILHVHESYYFIRLYLSSSSYVLPIYDEQKISNLNFEKYNSFKCSIFSYWWILVLTISVQIVSFFWTALRLCSLLFLGEIAAAFDKHLETFGGLDICINSAGISSQVPFWNDETEGKVSWRRVIEVDFLAVVDCTRLAVCFKYKFTNQDDGSLSFVVPIFFHTTFCLVSQYDLVFPFLFVGLWAFKIKVTHKLYCISSSSMICNNICLLTCSYSGIGVEFVEMLHSYESTCATVNIP